MSYYDQHKEFSELVGKTLVNVQVCDDDSQVRFETTDGESYLLYHEQDCCEQVHVESIVGDLQDLIGEPILTAEESSNEGMVDPEDGWSDSETWTFYKLSTRKGYVDIRWYGTSNGYYSESVSFVKEENGDN